MKKYKLAVVTGSRDSVVDFFKHFKKINVKFIKLNYYPVFGIDPGKFISGNRGNLSWTFIKNLAEQIKDCDGIYISDTYYFSNLQAVSLAKKYKIPIITEIWTTIPNHITTWFPPYSFITKMVVKATSLFILRSKMAFSFTDSLKIPRNKTIQIYKGVDLDKFKPGNTKERNDIKLLFVGNLTYAKGLDDLIYVFKKLRKTNNNLKLVVCGDGELKNQLIKSKNINYRGLIPYVELPSAYREADIFVAPSKNIKFLKIKVWEEYFSYTLMEAQASGLPIVATHCGGISEEIDSRNYIIPQGDKEALYNALESLIESSIVRRRLRDINRKRAEKLFDSRVQAKLTEKAILNNTN